MNIERFNPHHFEKTDKIYVAHISRYEFAASFIKKDDIVLDAACGCGYGTELLAKKARLAIGVDINQEAIEHCLNHHGKNNIKLITGDCVRLPLESETIDAYISFETIEHLSESQQRGYLQEAKRVLKKGGMFIVSTPNKEIYDKSLGEDGPNPFHKKELTLDEFYEILNTCFNESTLHGQYFDPTYEKMYYLEKKISELQWQTDKLSITLFKQLIPKSIRLLFSKEKNGSASAANRKFTYLSSSMRIDKINLDNAEYFIAVCRKI